jgi:hypothetical protein
MPGIIVVELNCQALQPVSAQAAGTAGSKLGGLVEGELDP